MEKMNRLGKSVNLLAVMAIASTGIIAPAIAGTDITPSQESLKLAKASLAGQCRAAKVQMPVFRAASTTSEALRLLAPDEQVTLADNSVNAKGFIGINGPIVGFVQAVNLKLCSANTTTPGTSDTATPGTSDTATPGTSDTATPGTSDTATPTSKDLCRRVVQPTQGLVIRREPTVKAAQVGSVAYLGRVTLTTNPPTAKRADDRDWVEISAPAKGWVSNGLLTEPKSNLVYCQ